jgi:hypothetical protein
MESTAEMACFPFCVRPGLVAAALTRTGPRREEKRGRPLRSAAIESKEAVAEAKDILIVSSGVVRWGAVRAKAQ